MANFPLPFTLHLTTKVSDFNRMLLNAFAQELNNTLIKSIPGIEQDISNNLSRIFINTNVYQALVHGPLDAHFGIPKGEATARLDVILNTLASSIKVQHKPVRVRSNTLTGGLTVAAFLSDFSDILKLNEGKVVTEKGQTLPWLEWLLIKGNQIIVSEHSIKFIQGKGRSGSAIMINDLAGVWRVPIGVSGTIRNNWITQAIDDAIQYLTTLTAAAVKKNIENNI